MRIQHIAAVTVVSAFVALAGCQNERGGANGSAGAGGGNVGSSSGNIPADARKIAEAQGSRVVHRPLRDGTVYVLDATSNKVVYKGAVRANSNVVVDPKANSVAVNDIDVKAKEKLDTRHKYALYFVQQ